MKSNNHLKYFILFLIFVNIFIWSFLFSFKQNDVLKIYFLDIGQGDATLIVAPNGRKILIDGGPDSSVLRELGKVMGFFDKKIDVVLATHPDQDHIGGLPLVFERYRVKNFIDSVFDTDKSSYRELEYLVKNNNIKIFYGMRGMIIVLDKKNGVYIHVLYPIPDDFKITDANDLSTVVRLVYGDVSAMLTGDAPKSVESKLVSTDGEYIRSSILKIGHHGSKTSTSSSFVSRVSPAYAIISAGKNNRYGHPATEIINILENQNIEILETFKEGTIEFQTNGIDVWQK